MREIKAEYIGEIVYSLCLDVSFRLPPDVQKCIEQALSAEESERGRNILNLLLENAFLAGENSVPICQDTGLFSVMLFVGKDTFISGDIRYEVEDAVRRATADGALRASVASNPLGERKNTGDNTPVGITCSRHSLEGTYLGLMAKGGGSEMGSAIKMLSPSSGIDGVVEFVKEVVSTKGPSACPPLFLGIGVGGSFDLSARLAKTALMAPFDIDDVPLFILDAGGGQRSGVSKKCEEAILNAVNMTGIGPGGFGGRMTCLGVRVFEAPCHIANLPVAVCLNCHALRRKIVQI